MSLVKYDEIIKLFTILERQTLDHEEKGGFALVPPTRKQTQGGDEIRPTAKV